ncbi:hypothetical protein HDU76_000474 [Blyttiomyces sp. JEL0837]|nr:hypothetical protein HDU76_000474 [Blyttiomyces sp. JEL0837]
MDTIRTIAANVIFQLPSISISTASKAYSAFSASGASIKSSSSPSSSSSSASSPVSQSSEFDIDINQTTGGTASERAAPAATATNTTEEEEINNNSSRVSFSSANSSSVFEQEESISTSPSSGTVIDTRQRIGNSSNTVISPTSSSFSPLSFSAPYSVSGNSNSDIGIERNTVAEDRPFNYLLDLGYATHPSSLSFGASSSSSMYSSSINMGGRLPPAYNFPTTDPISSSSSTPYSSSPYHHQSSIYHQTTTTQRHHGHHQIHNPPPHLTTTMSPSTFLSSTAYSDRARRLINLVNTLRDAGAHIELDLPTVVVCGNQSVGKSSLIEALCGVALPRAEGTCTRVVTEVRMVVDSSTTSGGNEGDVTGTVGSPKGVMSVGVGGGGGGLSTSSMTSLGSTGHLSSTNETVTTSTNSNNRFHCRVRLRYEYDDKTGSPLRTHRELTFGSNITNPAEVENRVRRAQRALLNPSMGDPLRYLSMKLDELSMNNTEQGENELKFSRNVVCVEIRGAAVNLTLIDLPGIIRTVERKEDSGFIEMIQELVMSYIKKERAIIVGTITCKDEIDNQAIVHMAREVDPYGLRTIGVLTKPDTIEPGTHDRWLQIMQGQTYPLKLGYWMIKNPSKTELDRHVSFEDARVREETFFASQSPWNLVRYSLERFGVDSLRREMGRVLAVVAEELSKVPPALGSVNVGGGYASLSGLSGAGGSFGNLTSFGGVSGGGSGADSGGASGNPRIELLQMVRGFCTTLQRHLAAHDEFKGFYQRVRLHFEAFRRSLYSTRPVFALDRRPGGGQSGGGWEHRSSANVMSSSGSGGAGAGVNVEKSSGHVSASAATMGNSESGVQQQSGGTTAANNSNTGSSSGSSSSQSLTSAVISALWSSSSSTTVNAAAQATTVEETPSKKRESRGKDAVSKSGSASVASVSPEKDRLVGGSTGSTGTGGMVGAGGPANPVPSSSTTSNHPTYSVRGSATAVTTEGDLVVDMTRPLTISDVRRVIEAQKGRELQGTLPYGAFTFLVAGFQEEWGRLVSVCLGNVANEVQALVTKLNDETFGRFVNLHGQVRFIIQMFQTELYQMTLERINDIVIMEKRFPFTMGSEEFNRLKSSALYEFKAQLEMARANNSTSTSNNIFGTSSSSSSSSSSPSPNMTSSASTSGTLTTPRPDQVNKALAALAEAGYTGLTSRDLARLRDNPDDDEVLHVMAASDAYFRMAFKRVNDVIPMHVDYFFLNRLGEGLERELVGRLGVLEKDSSAIGVLVMEDRAVVERRRALLEQRDRLEVVWRSLHEFGI